MTRHQLAIYGLALLLSFVMACSDDGENALSSDAAGPLPEDELASSLLLHENDLPPGWVVEADDGDSVQAGPLDECSAENQAGLSGRADSPDFNKGPWLVSQSIGVFESTTRAAEAFADPSLDQYFPCVVEVINRSEVNTPEFTYAEASSGPLPHLDVTGADEQESFRLVFTVTASSTGEEGPAHIDVYSFRLGRLAMNLVVVEPAEAPVDRPELLAIVETGLESLATARLNFEA